MVRFSQHFLKTSPKTRHEQDLGLGLGLDVPASLGLGLASNLVLLQSKTKTKVSQKHNLSNHIQSHSGEKSFKCNFCMKAFSQNGDLIYHKEVIEEKKHFSHRKKINATISM